MKIALSGGHALSTDAVRARIDARVAYYDQRYPSVGIARLYRWTDAAHATAEYRGGRARIAIGPAAVGVEMELPFFARLYRARIEDFVRGEIARITAPDAAESPRPPEQDASS